jgi:hypothetical protein
MVFQSRRKLFEKCVLGRRGKSLGVVVLWIGRGAMLVSLMPDVLRFVGGCACLLM